MTQYLGSHKSVMILGLCAALNESMAQERSGNVILGAPDIDRRQRGQQPSFMFLDDYPFYLREEDKPPSGIIFRDEAGSWSMIPNVDHCSPGGGDVDLIVAKHAKLRIEKAAAKRKRKNLKRIYDGQY